MAILEEWEKQRRAQAFCEVGLLTIRIQLIGLHSQVVPGVDFSVQLFLTVNVTLLGYSEELALVAGLADGVSAKERVLWFSTIIF